MTPSSEKTVVENVIMLMKSTKMNSAQVSKKSGLSKRMIDYILKGDRGISLASVDQLASAFNLSGWHLLIAGLNEDAARSGRLDKLVTGFNRCDKVAQEYLAHTAQKDANPPRRPDDNDQHPII